MQEFKFTGMDGADEVTISSVHVKVGQTIKKGDSIFDVEADKASETLTSPYDGTISKINFAAGDTIKSGDIIVEFGSGEKAKDSADSKKEQAEASKVDDKTSKSEVPTPAAKQDKVSETTKSVAPVTDNKTEQAEETTNSDGHVLATPLARKIARDLKVDITKIKGTVPAGRVLKADIEQASSNKSGETTTSAATTSTSEKAMATPANANTMPAVVGSGAAAINVQKIESFGPVEHMPISGIRKAVAKAMVTSVYTAPHVSLMIDIDATNLINLRAILKEQALKPENGAIKLTFMPFFIKAVAKALTEDRFKLINSTFNLAANEILVKKYYNIGMAADTDKGLVVPVIKNADKLSLFTVAQQVNDLAAKARKGELKAEEMQGGTFTITNFGSAGLKFGTPVINYPEVAILGLGALETKAVLINDEIVFHQFFPMSLSIDHRVIDGAPAGYFMQRIKEFIENPALILA